MCKMPIPPKVKTCPVCGKEFTRFEYFRINWLSKVIFAVIAAIVIYNIIVIIVFNKGIQKYKNIIEENPKAVDTLYEKYDNLNFIQKRLVRYSEIESLSETVELKQLTVGNESIPVKFYTETGSIDGAYKGEFVKDNIPEGIGEVVYTDTDGIEHNYEGQFEDGKIKGFGEMSLSTGELLKGNFTDGQLNGYGKRYAPDGSLAERGIYVNNQLNGEGTRFGKDGNPMFSGNFISGIPERTSYISSCMALNEDFSYDLNEYIYKNIKLSGMLTDVNTVDELGQYYIFSPNGDDKNRFMVFYEGKKMRFNLWDNYTIYGYCEEVEEVIDSHGKRTNGLKIRAYYIDKN